MGKIALGILVLIAIIAWHIGRGVGTAVSAAKAGYQSSIQRTEPIWIDQDGRTAIEFARNMARLQQEILDYCGAHAASMTLAECHEALVKDASPNALRLAQLLEGMELELERMSPRAQAVVLGGVATHAAHSVPQPGCGSATRGDGA